jgi:hypothetical protein
MFKLHYSWRALVGDLFGGLIAALIAIPYGLALASMMGLPPVLGLVTSIVSAPITAVLGRNPVLIGGTASATVPFIAHAVQLQGLAARRSLHGRFGFHDGLQSAAPGPSYSDGAAARGHRLLMRHRRDDGALPACHDDGGKDGYRSHVEQSAVSELADPFACGPGASRRVGHQRVRNCGGVCGRAFFSARSGAFDRCLCRGGAGGGIGHHEQEIGRLPFEIPPFAGFAWTPADVVTCFPPLSVWRSSARSIF